MSYKYRWILAMLGCGLIILFGYFYAIQPGLTRLTLLRKLKKDLLSELVNVTQLNSRLVHLPASKSAIERKATDWLTDLFTQLWLNDLKVKSIEMGFDSEHEVFAQLRVQGDFKNIFSFVHTLPLRYSITDFNYQLENNDYLFFMKIMASATENIEINQYATLALASIGNPFCHEKERPNIHSAEMDKQLLGLTSIQQIKMKGYIRQEKRIAALLLLPNGELFTAELGWILGQEQAELIDIQSNHVLFKLPNNKKILLSKS